jgi:hypothetical protein
MSLVGLNQKERLQATDKEYDGSSGLFNYNARLYGCAI